ncbi:MAG: hypothetical protein GXP24_11895 [Planctomycetes bacterium]|nr:hypothetical protein [Planctomycetota bacterium]
MIKALTKLFGAASSSRRDALTRQVAELSVESVCQLVAEQVECMSLSEARGYVRARAARIVRKQTRMAIGRHLGADLAWTDTIARTAIERIVPLVLRQTGVGVPKIPAAVRVAA